MNQMFRPPLITGTTPQAQIGEIVSYLRQLSAALCRLAESVESQNPKSK